jgi:dienelactone hydrolase
MIETRIGKDVIVYQFELGGERGRFSFPQPIWVTVAGNLKTKCSAMLKIPHALRYSLSGAIAVVILAVSPIALGADPETVHFKSRDAEQTPIRGLLFRPDDAGPYRTVLMMYGCSGLFRKDGNIQINLAAWIDRFVRWGYLVLAVDGFKPRGFRSMCHKRKRPLHSLDDRPYDAYGGLAWLVRQPFVQKDRIALVGWSNGAMATLSGLRRDSVEKFGGNLRFTAAAAFYPGCITLNKRNGGVYRPYAPLLVFVGLADNWTYPKPCIKLMEGAQKAGLVAEVTAYEGAYHAFDHPNLPIKSRTARNKRWKKKERTVTIGSDPPAREAAIKRLRGWLLQHLGG